MSSSPRLNGIAGVAALLMLSTSCSVGAAADMCKLDSGISQQVARAGLCMFDAKAQSFAGTPVQQASCLTRQVEFVGKIGQPTITPFVAGVVGKPAPAIQAVQALLDAKGIKEGQVGGPVDKPITANYFIIHDTSTPNCSAPGTVRGCEVRGEFPANRDDESWSFNIDFGGHPKPYPHRAAHAMTNRIGGSITEVDFADAIATTKFETCVDKAAKVNLFVGVENIQPRTGAPKIPAAGKKVNDRAAPTPGFTARQYERLALLYMVASARRGHWLVPAFHAVIDSYYADGHDDPQHFDMAAFSAELQKLVEAVGST
ncbi:hypothetical protein [Pseudomonas sp. UFMG81]|uniref:hypothetical protein n=1 Tax=Pseudomonas sp. UFMG81 TaxID=2745936 RepID=UPI00188F77A8|nr:hypothetical protein [Pseudomonas sp. UFMG81]